MNHTTTSSKAEGSTSGKLKIRPYKLKELADLYGVSTKTLNKWLEPVLKQVGKRQGHFYNTSQVKLIFHLLCPPYSEDSE